jgi:hypothetical protein
MTLSRKANDFFYEFSSELKHQPYLIINTVFAIVLLLVLAYSVIFSPDKDNYPVTCIHEKLTGLSCFSCGLSHSFSLILRGRIEEAYEWNIYGMRVFLFFVSQLIIRMVFSIYFVKYTDTRKQLIIIDCIGSSLIFLISFWPFLSNLVSGIV